MPVDICALVALHVGTVIGAEGGRLGVIERRARVISADNLARPQFSTEAGKRQ
jgi:hypothetical protein